MTVRLPSAVLPILCTLVVACGGGAGAGDPGAGDPRPDLGMPDVPDDFGAPGDLPRDGEPADPGPDEAAPDADDPGDVEPPTDARDTLDARDAEDPGDPADLAGDPAHDPGDPVDVPADTPDDAVAPDATDPPDDASPPDAPDARDLPADDGLPDALDPGTDLPEPDVPLVPDPGQDPGDQAGADDLPGGTDTPDEGPADLPAVDDGPADLGGPDLAATGLCEAPALPTWSRKDLAAGGTVAFNEIQYHPAGDARLEWLELHNPMAVDVDLSDWRLDGGVRYAFPPGTRVPARGFRVVAANPALLAGVTGIADPLGPWDGALDNGGERLELRNNTGRLMDTVDYDDDMPWPVAPDGSGTTLAKRNPAAASQPAENWASGALVGGTPGMPNFPDPLAPPHLQALVPWDATWAYDDSGGDPGDGWRQPGFDDSGWATGPAPFVARAAPATQPIAALVTAQDRFAVYVGRADGTGLQWVGGDSDGSWTSVEDLPFDAAPGDHVFVAAWETDGGDTRPQMLVGRFVRADGTALGTGADAFRWIPGPPDAVPEGGPADLAPEAGVLQGLVLEADRDGTWAVPQAEAALAESPWGPVVGASFPEGANCLWGDTFDDLSATNDLRTFALFRSVEPLVPAEAGTVLPPAPTTVRFRARFDLADDPARVLPWLDLWLDDGAVAWLNGVEVLRLVLPDGPVDPWTPAAWAVDEPQSWPGNLLNADALVTGPNVLAVEVHQAQAPDDDLAFAAEMAALVRPAGDPDAGPGLRFAEVAAGTAPVFWVELAHAGTTLADAGRLVVASSGGGVHLLGPRWMAPGERLLLDESSLGFRAAAGDRLFLLSPGRDRVLDALLVADRPRGRADPAQDAWLYPDASTPGEPNRFDGPPPVVINEIQFHHHPDVPVDGPPVASEEEWVELHNAGDAPVDLGGWQLVDDLQYAFPAGTTLPPGGFLVVARDAAALRAAYPDATILGDFTGRLDNSGGTILLRDACGNPVDQVPYRDGGRWPSFADGGGATLELQDPAADNAAPEAWSASDTLAGAGWATYAYEDVARPSAVGPDGRWQEFVLGLLDEGVVLLDDVSVVEDPAGAAVELIQDGTFDGGAATGWRLLGTHRHATVVPDPDDPGNPVLRLVATGPTEHMHNHAETTLSDGRTIVDGRTYRVSFRARWVAGSNRLNTRLYFNRLARTTALARPSTAGTPGRPNSTRRDDLGPTWDAFGHLPVVPAPLQPVRVQVLAADPDGVRSVTLWYAVDGGPPTALPMAGEGDGPFAALVPGQATGSVVQFWVEGVDGRGAASAFPARGADSRALWKVDDGLKSTTGLHDLRIVMTPGDAAWLHDPVNVMSNDRVGTTVIYDEREAFYDVGVRLKGSERGRSMPLRTGFALGFHAEQPFRGVHRTVLVDRSQGVHFGQREMLMNLVMGRAGSVSAEYDDLVQVLPPRLEHTGPAELQLARFGDLLLDTQFEDGGDGMLYEYELVYYPTTTDDGTPEGRKLPQPDLVVGTAIRDLGDDPEAYRHNFLVKNNPWRDDYAPLMAFAKVFGLPQADFEAAVPDAIDVDQWLRAFAFATLSGAIDNYASGAQHNADFYVRPGDGRALYFPHDLDFYGASPRSALVANADLARLLATPANRRTYYGHLLDIVRTSYNGEYMAPWCQQLGALLPAQDFALHLQFIEERAAWALDDAPDAVNVAYPAVPFQITTNGGQDFTVPDPAVDLSGTGWIDVRQVFRFGDPAPLPLAWIGPSEWQVTVPLQCGDNAIVLVAVDLQGTRRDSDVITIRSTDGCP